MILYHMDFILQVANIDVKFPSNLQKKTQKQIETPFLWKMKR